MFWLEAGPLTSSTTNIVYLCRPRIKHIKIIAGWPSVRFLWQITDPKSRSHQTTFKRFAETRLHLVTRPESIHTCFKNPGRRRCPRGCHYIAISSTIYPNRRRCHFSRTGQYPQRTTGCKKGFIFLLLTSC